MPRHHGKPKQPDPPPEPFWHFLVASIHAPIGAMLVVVGLLWAVPAWRAAVDDWDFEGAPTADAIVLDIERRSTGGKGASTVFALYRFQTPDGVSRQGEDAVPAGERTELDRTRHARVQYLAANPDRHRLFFPWMTASTAARANRVDLGIVLVLMATGAFLIGSGWVRATRMAVHGPDFPERRVIETRHE